MIPTIEQLLIEYIVINEERHIDHYVNIIYLYDSYKETINVNYYKTN